MINITYKLQTYLYFDDVFGEADFDCFGEQTYSLSL